MFSPFASKRVSAVLTEFGQITLLAREACVSLFKGRVAWRGDREKPDVLLLRELSHASGA